MEYCYNNKFKDDYPMNTIRLIRNKLSELGIFTVEESWHSSLDRFFSVRISIPGTSIATNGKGTTQEYSLAGAYGEIMERLQNFAPFRLTYDLSSDTLAYGGFLYAPDEVNLSVDDLLHSEEDWILSQLGSITDTNEKKELLKLWQGVSYEKTPSDFVGLPYVNITKNSISSIPVKMLSKMYLTNGMCAGNTRDEALIQGISEILERFANIKILKEESTPPTIPDDYIKKYPMCHDLICRLESNGQFRVIIKDCSCNLDFPILGAILINLEDHSYFIKFGAHPNFEIALERTLTELMQGQDYGKMACMTEFTSTPVIRNKHQNILNILSYGCGEYPRSFFDKHPACQFKPYSDYEYNSNHDMLVRTIEALMKKDFEVYIRDVSFLGFPSYHVIIPGMSEIEEISDFAHIRDYSLYNIVKKVIRNTYSSSSIEIGLALDYLEKRNYSLYYTPLDLINVPSNNDCLPWFYKNMELYTMALYLRLGDYKNAHRVLSGYLSKTGKLNRNKYSYSYFKCAGDYLMLSKDRLNDAYITEILETFYPNDLINQVKNQYKKSGFIFNSRSCISCWENCESCIHTSCNYIRTESIYRLLKYKYASGYINQKELINCIN